MTFSGQACLLPRLDANLIRDLLGIGADGVTKKKEKKKKFPNNTILIGTKKAQ